MSLEWQLTIGDQDNTGRWRWLPPPAIAGLDSPEGYLPRQDTVDAVNVSLFLGQPLLITGEPGCGKTALADWVAYKLGLGAAIRFQTRTTAVARDLFYHFDAVGRFHSAQTAGDADPREFIAYRALGEAIVRALAEGASIEHLVPKSQLGSYGDVPTRSVVLIDEIDKAPRDFPNDVLGELERFSFDIPELRVKEVKAPKEFCPIVIITSNGERSLPDAFLRRCVYHHLEFPDEPALREIISRRIMQLPQRCQLTTDALTVMKVLRDPRTNLRKAPGTAELLAFILMLRHKGCRPSDNIFLDDAWLPDALTILVKGENPSEAKRALQRLLLKQR
jgi:MoxR-like ATPase